MNLVESLSVCLHTVLTKWNREFLARSTSCSTHRDQIFNSCNISDAVTCSARHSKTHFRISYHIRYSDESNIANTFWLQPHCFSKCCNFWIVFHATTTTRVFDAELAYRPRRWNSNIGHELSKVYHVFWSQFRFCLGVQNSKIHKTIDSKRSSRSLGKC